jgi:hypothetical protein
MTGGFDEQQMDGALMPSKLILYCDYARSIGCDVTRMLSVLSGLHDATQQNPAMIAIDHNRNVLRDTIIGQRALNLGYQEGVVGAFRRG